MTAPLAPRLAYRVVNANTGAVVCQNLPHLHQSTWTVRALLAGYPGSSTLGTFSIPLPPPTSDLWRVNQATYLALVNAYQGQTPLKVEGYAGDVITGTPVVSGAVTAIQTPLAQAWTLSGMDTLWWLQQSQTFAGEQFIAPLSGRQLVRGCSGGVETVWDDDFATVIGSYTNSNWTHVSADPVFGLPAAQAGAGVTSSAVTISTWNASQQYVTSAVSITGTAVAGTAVTPSIAAGPGIWLVSDSTGANALQVEFRMRQTATGSGLYNIDLVINSWSAGTATTQTNIQNVFTNQQATFPFQLTAIYSNTPTGAPAGGFLQIRVLLNGKDANCVWNGFTPPFSGGVGIRFAANAGGSPTCYVNRITFHSRTSDPNAIDGWGTNRFQNGAQSLGSASFQQSLNPQGMTHLDLISLASMFDGFQLRKDAGAGFKGDSLDYSASPGTDYSSSVVFLHPGNVVDQGTGVATTADLLSTEPVLKTTPGSNNGGSIAWSRIGASGDMVLTDTTYETGAPDFASMVLFTRALQRRKVNPLIATQVEVSRDGDLLQVGNGFGPRELDFVQVHIPLLGINHQKQQIVGYTLDETKATMTYFLQDFPAAHIPQAPIGRIVRTLDWLTTTYQSR